MGLRRPKWKFLGPITAIDAATNPYQPGFLRIEVSLSHISSLSLALWWLVELMCSWRSLLSSSEKSHLSGESRLNGSR